VDIRSVVYYRRRIGPSTDPWGTPQLKVDNGDVDPAKQTRFAGTLRYEVNQ